MRLVRSALVLMVTVAAACSDRPSGAGGGSGDPGGTLVIAVAGTGSASMFPPHASDMMGRLLADNVYERLAEVGPELNTVGDRGFSPRLARSWQWASDSMSIAFAIDPRAKWHDGRPVHASDVRFTVDLLKDPKTATEYTSAMTNIDSVSVRDSLTAVAWFRRRTPEQFYDIVHQTTILPEHILKDIPREQLATSAAATHPVGSGRFRFARFDPGVRYEIVADTTHRRGRPKLDRVIMAFAADASGALAQLFSGQADYYETIPPDVLPSVDTSGLVRAVPVPDLSYVYLGMNQRDPKRLSAPHPIFGDRRVRQAISMALDRQSMLRNVFDTLGMLGVGPLSRPLADTTVALPSFDRARAAALLDSAGWRAANDGVRAKGGRPLSFGILVPTSSRPRMRYAVLIQEQLKSIGVNASIESADIATFSTRLPAGDFDAVLNGIGTDPTRSAVRGDWSTAAVPPTGKNYVRYSNRAFDALLDSAGNTFDPAQRDRHFHRAMQTIVDDAPAVWLYDVLSFAAAHKRIRPEGMRADAWWANLGDWWIPENERIERDRIGLRPPQP